MRKNVQESRLCFTSLTAWIVFLPRYKGLLRNARTFEFKQHDIILCTCTQSSTPGLVNAVSARQIIIDECGMATEPQALIPLVCNKPEKVRLDSVSLFVRVFSIVAEVVSLSQGLDDIKELLYLLAGIRPQGVWSLS